MKFKCLHIFLISILCFGAGRVLAQLSPGDLTEAHKELEGIGNCTQCHDLGNQVPDQKCLDCHTEIENLITANRGFHSSESVSSQTCVDCHSEHHGRKFEMSRFDEDNFDHKFTGYELEGMHAIIDCRACHQPDYIADTDLKERDDTFLGLSDDCLSCHQDFHQGTLSEDCISCHNFQDFRPAPGFDHDDAAYPLRGAHIEVDCRSCHAIYAKNGQDYQEFVDIPFADCISCHDDPHQDRIEGACAQCHTVSSFKTFVGDVNFDHRTTDFDLRGGHRQVACFDCHQEGVEASLIFADHAGVTDHQCISCHEDVHEGKFGTDCASCHNEDSFLTLREAALVSFDHSLTDYPLEGLHIDVDCKECHTTSFTDPIAHEACKNCHEDYHNGEFEVDDISPDCVACHTVSKGFDHTLYGLAEHQESQFPLEGGHIATPCFACHVNEEEHWTFRNIGSDCIDCHVDIHEGLITASFYPDQSCTSCHGPDNWTDITFDHNTTDWPLEGRHVAVSCRQCHFDEVAGLAEPAQTFIDLSTNCIDCHDNPHGVQFEIEGVTDCRRCHHSESWDPDNFDHNQTAFPLDGRHAEVSCIECHQPTTSSDGTLNANYKIERFECIDCHS